MFLYNAIGIFSESALSLYPIIIKLTTLDVPFNTFIRLTSYLIISALFANYEVLSGIGIGKLIALASINIAHILSSYYGFRALVPSMAQSIFYLYPFINMLLNIVILGETISPTKFLFILPVIYSIYQIYGIGKTETLGVDLQLGLIMIAISAITESLLYILIKSVELGNNPWNSVLVSYSLAAILYGVYYLYNNGLVQTKDTIVANKKEVFILVLLNMLIGSLGYGLRFWSIPRIPSVTHSIISYTGIFTTVLYSFYLGIEKINISKVGYLGMLASSLLAMKLL